MKKLLIILMSLVVLIAGFIFINNKANSLQIVKEKSFFSDFYVEGDKAYIQCEITINNFSSTDKIFKLNAISEDDVKVGLLKTKNLKGYNQELTSDKFTIKKKSTQTFVVVFTGEFAGTYKKYDRKIPEVIIIKAIN